MVVTRGGFSQVVGNAFAGLGFAPEGPSVYEFPIEMFVGLSDLTPINENIDKIIYGLTKWQPKVTEKGILSPGKNIVVQGKDYQEAVANMNNLFLRNMWSDGLPLVPATTEQVDWILTGTDLPPDTVVSKIGPRGGIGSVEAIAISLALAGGRPEYLPVLIAAVEVLDKDDWRGIKEWNATTCATIPAVIVNGPIGQQIRLNSGYGCLGPDPQHPAGGSIGRALRIILQDLGGGIPGIGTMAMYGAMRYTNMVFAEDEAGIGEGWEPLNVSYFGQPKGTNTASSFICTSVENLEGAIKAPLGPKGVLMQHARMMGAPRRNRYGTLHGFGEGTTGVLLWPRGIAKPVAADLGWSRIQAQEYLWENSKVPWLDVERVYNAQDEIEGYLKAWGPTLVRGEPWPITGKPENIPIVVCGGSQSGHSHWLSTNDGYKPGCVEIKLPAEAKWDALLKQAETDLGPIPPPML